MLQRRRHDALNQTADLLSGTIAAPRATALRVHVQEPDPPFTGHAICSSSEWINGLSNPVGESYHPNRTGHSSGYLPLVRQVVG